MFRACSEVKTILLYLGHIYFVTFMVFPGLTNSTTLTFLDSDGPWFQIFFMTTFNLFDTIGRYIGGQPNFFISQKLFYIQSWLRFLHIAAFFIFAYYEDIFDFIKTPTGDAIKILNMGIFAFSNGYL